MNALPHATEPAPMGFGELVSLVGNHLRRAARYWPRGALLLVAILGPGLYWAAKRPRLYTSSAAFEVAAPDGSQLGPDERDRALEQRVAQAWDTQATARSILDAERLYPSLRGRVSRERQREEFQSHLRWRVEGGAIRVGFSDPDPAVAERVVHRMIARFADDGRSASRDRARLALATVEAQRDQAERALSVHEEALADFERANPDAVARLRARDSGAVVEPARNPAASARTRLLRARVSSLDVQQRSLQAPSQPAPANADALRSAESRVVAAREALTQAQGRYVGEHPRLVAAARELSDAQAALEAERARAVVPEAMSARDRAERVAAVERDLAAARGELAESEAADVREDAGVRAVQAQAAGTLPEVEAQWLRLRANLATARAEVQSLLQQKYQRQAALARVEMEGAAPLRVIDAPSRPMDPDPPGRAKLSGLVALVALALGLGLSWLSGAADSHIYDQDDLARWGEIALLEAIPELDR